MIQEYMQEFFDAREKANEWVEKKEVAKKKIEMWMLENDKKEYADEQENVVKISEVSRNGVDTKKVKDFLGDRYNEFVKVSTYTKVDITTPQDRNVRKKFIS
jgi:predicted phage-related endonuclease